MIHRVVVALCCLARFAPAQEPACRHVEGDRIVARDLADTLPVFSSLPPETLLANAPMPGSRRVFHTPEILALVRRYSLDLPSSPDVCFEWAMKPLDRNQVVDAMRASLQIADVRIEIAEMSMNPVPPGRIEFAIQHLGTPAAPNQRAPVLWRGDVIYGADRRFAIWARVWIQAHCTKLFALEILRPGQLIEGRQLRTDSAECFPDSSKTTRADQFVGTMPLRTIAAGTEVRSDLVTRSNDVTRGDMVEVEVRSGAARLAFSARAETSGRTGETITVRNPDSKSVFRARVSGRGRAMVQAGSPKVD
jgi:flagellar basal body P-ring formation protein FlgA